MSYLCSDLADFNADISSWDTSGVTDMNSMFYVRSPRVPCPYPVPTAPQSRVLHVNATCARHCPTRWRWCFQRAISVRAAALTQHGTRCWASVAHTRTRWWFLAERAYSRTAQVARRGGGTRTDRLGPPAPPRDDAEHAHGSARRPNLTNHPRHARPL
eukprot:scaffold18996_cov57-Phaeocystis_antarctica.AAC.5